MTTIDDLRKLKPDWDGYGARVPTESALYWATFITGRLSRLDLTPVPLTDGGVQLETHSRGMDIEITIQECDVKEPDPVKQPKKPVCCKCGVPLPDGWTAIYGPCCDEFVAPGVSIERREQQRNEFVPTIGADARCTCTCADPCPLGGTGMAMRCTRGVSRTVGTNQRQGVLGSRPVGLGCEF